MFKWRSSFADSRDGVVAVLAEYNVWRVFGFWIFFVFMFSVAVNVYSDGPRPTFGTIAFFLSFRVARSIFDAAIAVICIFYTYILCRILLSGEILVFEKNHILFWRTLVGLKSVPLSQILSVEEKRVNSRTNWVILTLENKPMAVIPSALATISTTDLVARINEKIKLARANGRQAAS